MCDHVPIAYLYSCGCGLDLGICYINLTAVYRYLVGPLNDIPYCVYIYNINIIKHNKTRRSVWRPGFGGQSTPKFGSQLTLAASRLVTPNICSFVLINLCINLANLKCGKYSSLACPVGHVC